MVKILGVFKAFHHHRRQTILFDRGRRDPCKSIGFGGGGGGHKIQCFYRLFTASSGKPFYLIGIVGRFGRRGRQNPYVLIGLFTATAGKPYYLMGMATIPVKSQVLAAVAVVKILRFS